MLGRSAADPNLAAIQALLGGPQKSRYSFAQPQVSFTTPRQPISQGSLSPQKRSISQYLEDKAGDVLRSAGVAPHNAARFAHKALGAFNDLTPVGNVTGAQEGYGLLKQGVTRGDVATGALGLGSLMLSILPGVNGAKKPLKSLLHDTTGAIRAWHGSPHDFDRFDMSKIGTGEGAQAYGHGLYFAENKKVAEEYRDELTKNALLVDGTPSSHLNRDTIYGIKGITPAAKEHLAWYITRGYTPEEALKDAPRHMSQRDVGSLSRAIESGRIAQKDVPGRLYEVNINAEPEDFLDWDRPLGEQGGAVKNYLGSIEAKRQGALASIPPIDGNMSYAEYDALYGPKLNEAALNRIDPKWKGSDFIGAYSEAVPHNGQDWGNYKRTFTDHMRGGGIPGIRYLDQGSRQTGGTSNYVVFDDKLIDILNKF